MNFKIILVLLVSTIDSGFLLTCLKKPNAGKWISNGNFLPSKAIYGGQEKTNTGKYNNLYICQIDGYAGKILPNKQCRAYILGDPKETIRNTEFLTEVEHIVWVPVDNLYKKGIPCNSITTRDDPRDSTFVGRTYINKFNNNNLIPGNIIKGVLHVAYYGTRTYNSYEVLTAVPKSLTIPAFKSSIVLETLGSYLTFQVRSEDEVSIDFGIGSEIKIRLTIGQYSIKVSGQSPISNTKQLINGKTLKGFWVRWISGSSFEVGKDRIIKPLTLLKGNYSKAFDTVVFSSGRNSSFWKIADLPAFKNSLICN